MTSYTYMSTEALKALTDAIMDNPSKLNLQLNHTDALNIIDGLCFIHVYSGNQSLANWASDFLSSLAQVHDIEWV